MFADRIMNTLTYIDEQLFYLGCMITWSFDDSLPQGTEFCDFFFNDALFYNSMLI